MQHRQRLRMQFGDERRGEHGRGDAAVHVQLVVVMLTVLHVDQHRRKHAGHAGRGHQHVAEGGACGFAATRSDGAHVPQHGLALVQVGGGDHQPAALGVFARDGLDHGRRHEAIDQRVQRSVVVASHGGNQAGEQGAARRADEMRGGVAAEGPLHGLVPAGAEVGERRQQGAHAHARDQFVLRARVGAAEPRQRAHAKGASRAAAGQRQDVDAAVGCRVADALEELGRTPGELLDVRCQQAHALGIAFGHGAGNQPWRRRASRRRAAGSQQRQGRQQRSDSMHCLPRAWMLGRLGHAGCASFVWAGWGVGMAA